MRNVAVQLDHHEPYLRFYYRKREKIKQYEFFLEKLKKKKRFTQELLPFTIFSEILRYRLPPAETKSSLVKDLYDFSKLTYFYAEECMGMT